MRVVFSYARSKEKLMKLARDAHGSARAGTPSEAAKEADALLLAGHWSRIEEVLKQAGDLSGKVIVSCSLPMNADNTELVFAHTSSGVETLAKMVPKARVVSAFNTVPSEVLFGVYEARRKAGRPSLFYCGDDRSGKALAPCSRAGTSAFPFRVEIENIARCPCSFVRVQGGAPMTNRPAALFASEAPPRAKPTTYPEPFASRMAGRVKRPLGELFGLTNFGVNLTRLAPGAASSLHHRHSRQDELIYVLEGEPTLFADAGEMQLHPVMVAGFAAGGTAHHLENRTERDCVILEIGDRAHGDEGSYPADDIQAAMGEDEKWRFSHKDGRPYWKALAGKFSREKRPGQTDPLGEVALQCALGIRAPGVPRPR